MAIWYMMINLKGSSGGDGNENEYVRIALKIMLARSDWLRYLINTVINLEEFEKVWKSEHAKRRKKMRWMWA